MMTRSVGGPRLSSRRWIGSGTRMICGVRLHRDARCAYEVQEVISRPTAELAVPGDATISGLYVIPVAVDVQVRKVAEFGRGGPQVVQSFPSHPFEPLARVHLSYISALYWSYDVDLRPHNRSP